MNLPGSATEDEFHISVAELLDACLLPPTFYTTFPAGYGKLGKATAGKLKAKGMKAGFPDIVIFDRLGVTATKVIGLELKTSIGRLNGNQRTTHARLQGVNVKCYTIRTLNEVLSALRDAGINHRKLKIPFERGESDAVVAPGAVGGIGTLFGGRST